MKFEDMSREDLVASCKSLWDSLMRDISNAPISPCAFCHGTGYVHNVKQVVRDDMVTKWWEPMTQEEYENYATQKWGKK